MIDPILIITAIVGFISISFVIWNSSRKLASLELEVRSIREELHTTTKGLDEEIQRQTVERQGDIAKTLLSSKDDLNNLQKQIDSTKADVKSLLSKIEVLNTKILNSESIHIELKNEISKLFKQTTTMVSEQLSFITVWNQRIEDRIEALRTEYLRMLAIFHGPNKDEM